MKLNDLKDRKKVEAMLLSLLLLAASGIVICQVLRLEALVSLLFYLTFPLTWGLWLLAVVEKRRKSDWLVLASAALAVASVVISGLLAGQGLSVTNIKKAVIFGTTMVFLQTACRGRIGQKTAGLLFAVTDVLSVVFTLAYVFGGESVYEINGVVSRYLTLNFTNPNLVSMFLCCLCMLELARAYTLNNWGERIPKLIFAFCDFYLLVKTQARNAELALGVFLVGYVWLCLTKKKTIRLNRVVSGLIGTFPLTFAVIYMAVINNEWINNTFSFLVTLGKGLDSRVKIWVPGWEIFLENPIFGACHEIMARTEMSHLHNTHLDVAGSYGIVVLVLVCVYLSALLYRGGKGFPRERFVYILGFIAVIVMGMGEAALFSGGLSLYIFMGSFLMLANQRRPGKKAET